MFAEMDMRSKLGVGFIALVAMVAVLMVLDRTVFRPREPIYAFTDRETLEQELGRVITATSAVGSWGGKQTIQRSRLVVSANFTPRSSDRQSVELLIEALKSNAWRTYGSSPSKALATFCKGRYRVNLWPMEDGQISASFLVKEFERDADCVAQ